MQLSMTRPPQNTQSSGNRVHKPGRRTVLAQMGIAGFAAAFASPAWGAWQADTEEMIPFSDVPDAFRPTGQRLDPRVLPSWITPNNNFFQLGHYGSPKIDAAAWKLEATGSVGRRRSYRMEELKKRPRVQRTLFFECSGNSARMFHGTMGNATWTGTPLRELLRELRPAADAKEVIFWGADAGEETLRGNKFPMRFARSMSIDDAMNSDALLAYEMNGEPLPVGNGFPMRLVVPGWYGISNVKWLTHIELSPRPFMGRFMARDYVNILGRDPDGDGVLEFTEVSVTRIQVKSVVWRVTRLQPSGRTKVFGAAWGTAGTPLKTVEVSVNQGPWQTAKLEPNSNPHAWTFFTLETEPLPAGEHAVVSRATDQQGRQQLPDAELSRIKKTNWENNGQFIRKVRVG